MTKTETGAPWAMSAALLVFGALVMVASETTVGVWAFSTADRAVMLLGQPVDALNKVAIGALAGAIAYGGAAVTAWLLTHDRAALRRQGRIALAVTACASLIAVWNLSTAFAWYRRSAEAPAVRASVEWAEAKATYAEASARLSGARRDVDGAGFVLTLTREEASILREQAAAALETVRRGEKPKGSEPPTFWDVIKALVAHLLGVAPAAAFRLPAPRQKKRPKRQAGASRARLAVVK